ncbi:MAG TPA: hypothetical protein VF751_10570, partial [Chthoniobacterales bacterium]
FILVAYRFYSDYNFYKQRPCQLRSISKKVASPVISRFGASRREWEKSSTRLKTAGRSRRAKWIGGEGS